MVYGGLFSHVPDTGHYIATDTFEKRQGLGTYQAQVHLQTRLMLGPHGCNRRLEQVDVQPATQAAIGGHNHITNPFDFPLLHVGMAILGHGIGDMSHHIADATSIGFTQLHSVLGPAHFARGDHFHGAGDLLSTLDTRDLGANFLSGRHRLLPGLG